MDKPVNSSKNLAGNRVQLHKPCTLLNEWIFQWHSPFPYGNVHKNTKQKPERLYINYYSICKMFQVLIRVNKTMWKEKKKLPAKMCSYSAEICMLHDCNIYGLENNKARYKYFGWFISCEHCAMSGCSGWISEDLNRGRTLHMQKIEKGFFII